MRYGAGMERRKTHKAVPCVIGIAVVVAAYCFLVPAKQSRTAPTRSVPEAGVSSVAEPQAADIKAPPQALRRGSTELRIEDGKPPVIPDWEEGLLPDEVRDRERVEALSKGGVPADWDSIDRPWAEDEVLGLSENGATAPVVWGEPPPPPKEATGTFGS